MARDQAAAAYAAYRAGWLLAVRADRSSALIDLWT